ARTGDLDARVRQLFGCKTFDVQARERRSSDFLDPSRFRKQMFQYRELDVARLNFGFPDEALPRSGIVRAAVELARPARAELADAFDDRRGVALEPLTVEVGVEIERNAAYRRDAAVAESQSNVSARLGATGHYVRVDVD